MNDLLTSEEIARLFTSFARTAFRLETRDFYDVDSEQEPFRRFLAGEPAEDSWMSEFCQQVRDWSAEGKRMQRVRVVSVPHSDYVEWSLQVARLNIEAGEDIRYLPRDRAGELRLPHEDYWLFDSQQVVVLRFDDRDRLLGGELVEDRAEVVKRCTWRDMAWRFAVPWRQYLAS